MSLREWFYKLFHGRRRTPEILRGPSGKPFWGRLCEDPMKAIEFAIKINDHYDRLEFLENWVEGDVSEWPEFFEYVGMKL